MQEALPPGDQLVYTEPTEAFFLYIKMAALAGLVLAIPVILYQLWLFVAPGLYVREKRFAIPFVVFATVFFAGRRAVLPLHVVPVGLALLRQLLRAIGHHAVHAPHPAGVFPVREAAARLRAGVSNADAGLLPGPGRRGDARISLRGMSSTRSC